MLAVQGRVLVFFFWNPCKVFQVKKKKGKKRGKELKVSLCPFRQRFELPDCPSLSSKAVSSRYELRARCKRTAKLDRQGVESARFDLG